MDNQSITKKRFYKRWWFWVIFVFAVIIIVAIAGSGDSTKNLNETGGNQEGQSAAENTKTQEVIKTTGLEISEAYKANEVAADAKYKGKLVEISGTVDTIGKDILNTPYISLEGYKYAILDKVQCMFAKSDESKLIDISKGQQITLKGKVSGKLGNIVVNDCQIVK